MGMNMYRGVIKRKLMIDCDFDLQDLKTIGGSSNAQKIHWDNGNIPMIFQ